MALNRENSDSDSDLEPGQLEVSNVLRQLRRSDVVRFSPTDGNMVMSGEIQDEPTIDENGNVISIVMKHLDTYKKGASQTYRCPAGFRWIILEEIDTPAILNFCDLKPRMYIKTWVACGGEVRG